MTTILRILISIVLFSLVFGCKDFLNVEPLHKLSGNMYWKTESDVEAFTLDLYAKYKNKLISTSFIPATGEFRSGWVRPTENLNNNSVAQKNIRLVYRAFSENNLRRSGGGVLDGSQPWANLNFVSITRWQEFYQVIQGANILYDQVDKGIPGLGKEESLAYKAEAVFIRNFAYFNLVRIFGDVSYYITPYDQELRARKSQIDVLKACMEDLKKVIGDLRIGYEDPVFRANRATRGAGLALLMHMNMWCAGFDDENEDFYCEQVVNFGRQLINLGVYKLLAIEDFEAILKGKSQEGIFEFNQSVNYEGVANPLSFFGESVLKYPNKGVGTDNQSSHAFILSSFLQKLYPNHIVDKRRDLWFDENMYAENGNFQLLKFAGNIIPGQTGNFAIPEWGFIIFRYADVLLLQAEALEKIGESEEAIRMLNLVRTRAASTLYSPSENLADAIFIERCKELMGEGHLFFDLVRTRRILSQEWAPIPMTAANFDSGAWTWPIDPNALFNNPNMTLNTYW